MVELANFCSPVQKSHRPKRRTSGVTNNKRRRLVVPGWIPIEEWVVINMAFDGIHRCCSGEMRMDPFSSHHSQWERPTGRGGSLSFVVLRCCCVLVYRFLAQIRPSLVTSKLQASCIQTKRVIRVQNQQVALN